MEDNAYAVRKRKWYWLAWLLFGGFFAPLFMLSAFSHKQYTPPAFEQLRKDTGRLSFSEKGKDSTCRALVIKPISGAPITLSCAKPDNNDFCGLARDCTSTVIHQDDPGKEAELRSSILGKEVTVWWHPTSNAKTDGLMYQLMVDGRMIAEYRDKVEKYLDSGTSLNWLYGAVLTGMVCLSLWHLSKKEPPVATCKMPAGIHYDNEKRQVFFVSQFARRTRILSMTFTPIAAIVGFVCMLLAMASVGLASFISFVIGCTFIGFMSAMLYTHSRARSECVVVDAEAGNVTVRNRYCISVEPLGALQRISIGATEGGYIASLQGTAGDCLLPICKMTKGAIKEAIEPVGRFLGLPVIEE
jgi:hypothetical protein